MKTKINDNHFKLDIKTYYFDVYWNDEEHPELFSEFLKLCIEDCKRNGDELKICDRFSDDEKPFHNMKTFIVSMPEDKIGYYRCFGLGLLQSGEWTVNGIVIKNITLGDEGIVVDGKYISSYILKM